MHNREDNKGETDIDESESALSTKLSKIDCNSSFDEIKAFATQLKNEFMERVSSEIVECGDNSLFRTEDELIRFNYQIDYLDKIAHNLNEKLFETWCNYAFDEEEEFMIALKSLIQEKKNLINQNNTLS